MRMRNGILKIFLVYFSVLAGPLLASYIEEGKIFEKLFRNYNNEVKPELETRKPVDVSLDIKLKSVNELNPKTQVLDIDVFIVMIWFDPRLVWNSTEYNGTTTVHVERTKLWTPDVVLYNRAGPSSSTVHTDIYTTKVLVNYEQGRCVWRNLVTLKASCQMDMTWFPLDKQSCELNFGSWSYSMYHLKLNFIKKPSSGSAKNIKAGNFGVDSGQWTIDSFKADKEPVTFSCCPGSYSSIKYTLVMSRVSLYYFIYILMPVISLAFMFLLVFHIPPDSGERMGYGVTILLSITVYLLVISEKLPEKSDDTPMLGVCFISIFYVLIFGLFVSAITSLLSRRKSQPPEWLVKLTKTGCCKRKKKEPVTRIEPVWKHRDAENVVFQPMYFRNVQNDSISLEKKEINKTEVLDNEEIDYNKQWISIAHTLDKKCFIFFALILIITPLTIVVSLPTTGLA